MMLPMMYPGEVHVIEKALLSRTGRPLKVLEWGSGGSTVYFTKFLKLHNIQYEWISLEYNKRWADTVTAALGGDLNTHVVLFDVGNDEVLQRDIPMNEYVTYPSTLNQKFDLILVDGRKRRRCLVEARALVSDGGVVFCHDAERAHYQCAFKEYPRGRYLQGRLWEGSLTAPPLLTGFVDAFRSYSICTLYWVWRKTYRMYKSL